MENKRVCDMSEKELDDFAGEMADMLVNDFVKKQNKKLIDDLFEAAKDDDDVLNELKTTNAILDNIENLLTEIAKIVTGSIQC